MESSTIKIALAGIVLFIGIMLAEYYNNKNNIIVVIIVCVLPVIIWAISKMNFKKRKK